MKINMEQYKRMHNGSHYYADMDKTLLEVFGHFVRDSKVDGDEIYDDCIIIHPERKDRSTYKGSRNIYDLYFNENGISISMTGNYDPTKKLNFYELEYIVDYISDFYKKMFDNGFLVK